MLFTYFQLPRSGFVCLTKALDMPYIRSIGTLQEVFVFIPLLIINNSKVLHVYLYTVVVQRIVGHSLL